MKLEIEIFGMGGRELMDLEKNLLKALGKMGVEASFTIVSDPKKIAEAGILNPPALIVNGELKFEGRVPTVHELIREYLK